MHDRNISQDRRPIKLSLKHAVQATVVLTALLVAIVLASGSNPAQKDDPGFDMLGYIDSRVASQENTKDVRCWSSFCKLQMFLTGMEIEPEAMTVRINEHVKLIESIWNDSRAQNPGDAYVKATAVSEVLASRFPQAKTESGTTFNFDNGKVSVMPDAILDYSDTIEPWRLLQMWATRHLDSNGRLKLAQPFDEEALTVLYGFFREFDLAILEHARTIAYDRKLTSIDAASMSTAFATNVRDDESSG